MLLGLTGVAAADIAVTRAPQPYMLGVVVLTGRILRYENGVLRAERARIACLVRPPWVSRALTGRLAEQFGVPSMNAFSLVTTPGKTHRRSGAGARASVGCPIDVPVSH